MPSKSKHTPAKPANKPYKLRSMRLNRWQLEQFVCYFYTDHAADWA